MTTATKPNLVSKLVEVGKAISHIEKAGTNDFHKYDYAKATDVYAAVRKELFERNILFTVEVQEVHHDRDGKNVLTTIRGEASFWDGDGTDSINLPFAGTGSDTGDKSLYKALTGGVKNVLISQAFLLPTVDDPEADAEADAETDRRTGAQQPAPTQRTNGAVRTPAPLQPTQVQTGLTNAQKSMLAIKYKELGLVDTGHRRAANFALVGKGHPDAFTNDDLNTILERLAQADVKEWADKIKADFKA